MAKKKQARIDEIVEEAKESFDLATRLAGISRRTRDITIYTDEVTGEALGGVEHIHYPGTKAIAETRRWGVRGEIDELREEAKALLGAEEVDQAKVDEIKARLAALAKKEKTLLAKLKSTSHDFTLRAVPELVFKATARKARRNLSLPVKGNLDPEQAEDYNDELYAILLSECVVEWVDHAEKATRTAISVADARALNNFVLPEEWGKVRRAIDELQAQKAIGDAGTADPDF